MRPIFASQNESTVLEDIGWITFLSSIAAYDPQIAGPIFLATGVVETAVAILRPQHEHLILSAGWFSLSYYNYTQPNDKLREEDEEKIKNGEDPIYENPDSKEEIFKNNFLLLALVVFTFKYFDEPNAMSNSNIQITPRINDKQNAYGLNLQYKF